jgi:hypothetical protein
MKTLCEPLELLSRHLGGEIPCFGQSALPFTANLIALCIVVLLDVGELRRVVGLCLACAERFRDG